MIHYIGIILLDATLRSSLGKEICVEKGPYILNDVCYYVDDFRLVLTVPKEQKEEEIKENIVKWLQSILDDAAPGHIVKRSKTQVTVEGRESRYLVPQSKVAKRIQSGVSGVFDMVQGTALIGTIEGFFHTQQHYPSSAEPSESGRSGLLVGMSDMRDDTARRFAAWRFRKTFRSLRPLLQPNDISQEHEQHKDNNDPESVTSIPSDLVLSQQSLDERARLFAALLIEEWIANPANIRLLRIAFDIFPDEEYLDRVLCLLRPGWKRDGVRGPRREVRLYCLSEIFRAGAIETAIVSDNECLPEDASPKDFRARLREEGLLILKEYYETPRPRTRHPWYLLQQVLLFLSTQDCIPELVTKSRGLSGDLLSHYRSFGRFFCGVSPQRLEERAIFTVILYSGFDLLDEAHLPLNKYYSKEFLIQLNGISPLVAMKVWHDSNQDIRRQHIQIAERLGLQPRDPSIFGTTIADIADRKQNIFTNEEPLLILAEWLLQLYAHYFSESITPWQIRCEAIRDQNKNVIQAVPQPNFAGAGLLN